MSSFHYVDDIFRSHLTGKEFEESGKRKVSY